MAINLQQLRYARALAEARSFVAAAERCHVTQPTLSNAIAQLERDLGQPLFARTTRSVNLTPFGAALLPSIAEVLNAQAALLARARQLVHPARPLIQIGVSPLIGPEIVTTLTEPFRRANPDTEIVLREMNLAEMVLMLQNGQLDFLFGPVDLGHALPVGWQAVTLHSEALIYICKGAQAGSAAEVALGDLADETFVMVPDACGLARTTRALFAANGVGLREYPGQALSYRVLQEWAAIGIGAAILPRSKVMGVIGARLVLRSGQDRPVSITYQAQWCPRAGQGPEFGELARFLTDVAPTLLAGLA